MSILEAVSGFFLLVLATISAATTLNAVRPFRHTLLLVPSMLWSWFVLGMLGQTLLVQVILAAFLIWLGALDTALGWVAIAVLAASWAVTVSVIITNRKAGAAVDAALDAAGVQRTSPPVPTWRKLLVFPFRGRSVVIQRGVTYRRVAGTTLKLDVYSDGSDTTDRPIFMYIHGGGWVMGDKREQGLPIIHHLARNGWVCFSVNYRLSPIAGWPDQLVDVKYALGWIRSHAHEYGGDPSFVAVAGGSAGGHLAALVGLTGNQRRYQPGFESADTSAQVVAPIYGITDVTNRLGVQNPQFLSMLMEPLVIKAYLEDEPDKFFAASPIDQVHPDAPPFVISQGARDSMAPVEEARAFVDKLRRTSNQRVVYMEFPGAQHIFDLGYSYQCGEMIAGVHSVLDDEYRRYRNDKHRI
jgi:acetyl esterase/lipase